MKNEELLKEFFLNFAYPEQEKIFEKILEKQKMLIDFVDFVAGQLPKDVHEMVLFAARKVLKEIEEI
jgi:hypothetical protein